MTDESYALHGLVVRSALPLGQPLRERHQGDVHLAVEVGVVGVGGDAPPPGDVIAQLVLSGQRLYTAVEDAEQFVLRIHGACDFVIDRSLCRVECRALPSVEPELLSLLARGGLLALLLGLGGSCVLHASAVETAAGSVVFVGPSGTGKSTLAALACRDGAQFVTDDLLRVDHSPTPSWVGQSAELRLRPGAAPMVDGLDWTPRGTVDGRTALHPPSTPHPQGRIGAVVVPAPTRRDPDLTVQRIDPLQAMLVLSAFPRLQWTSAARSVPQFEGVTRLVNAVPVYRAHVPWGPPFETGLGSRLLNAVLAGRG